MNPIMKCFVGVIRSSRFQKCIFEIFANQRDLASFRYTEREHPASKVKTLHYYNHANE